MSNDIIGIVSETTNLVGVIVNKVEIIGQIMATGTPGKDADTDIRALSLEDYNALSYEDKHIPGLLYCIFEEPEV